MAKNDFLVGDDADSVLQALMAAPSAISTDVSLAIATITKAFDSDEMEEDQIHELLGLIPMEYIDSEEVGADFDMKKELGMQHRMVNAMRNQVMTAGGKIRKDIPISEAKAVLDSCRTFGEVIRKNMESTVNLSRIQALEAAVLVSVSDFKLVDKQEFLKTLEEQLSIFCK